MNEIKNKKKWYLYKHCQQLLNNFLSHTHFILFLSILFLTNKEREEEGCFKKCRKIIVYNSLLI